jgi:REP element-mobilizing transposase RayT
LFENQDLGQIVASEIYRSDKQTRTYTYAYVVMPDHVHWLFQLVGPTSLALTLRHMKGRSARRINLARFAKGPVWQPGFHDRALRNGDSAELAGKYIVANPVRAGLVTNVDDYALWDLMWRRKSAADRG